MCQKMPNTANEIGNQSLESAGQIQLESGNGLNFGKKSIA